MASQRIEAGFVTDDFDAGSGFQTVLLDYSGDADGRRAQSTLLTLTLGRSTVTFEDASTAEFSLRDIERWSVIGSAGRDVVISGPFNDTVLGATGDDNLIGEAGDDLLIGGDGHDQLEGDAGDDRLRGNAGADTLNGDGGTDRLEGGSGNDSLNGGEDDDRLDGGAGNDVLVGGAGRDQLFGGAGDDTLSSGNPGSGPDSLVGGAGNDRVTFSDPGTVALGGAGFDHMVLVSLETGLHLDLPNGTLRYANGKTSTFGGFETYDVALGSGDDTVIGGFVTDNFIKGGAGFDTISLDYSGRWNGRTATSLSTGQDPDGAEQKVAAITFDDGSSRIVSFFDFETAYLRGSKGPDTLNAGDWQGRIEGGPGDDVLRGTAGNLTLVGGVGQDALNGSDADQRFESGAGDDFIRTGGGADTVKGGAGDDLVFAEGDAAQVFLGGGDDTARISGFGTTIDGGGGQNSLFFSLEDHEPGAEAKLLGARFRVEGQATSHFSNFNEVGATMTLGDDRLDAGAARSSLFGMDGFDHLTLDYSGAAAADITGITLRAVDAARAEMRVSQADGPLLDPVIDGFETLAVTGSAGADRISGLALGDLIAGAGGDDTLQGNDGKDTILGGAGRDSLVGGAGGDILTGGVGPDIFNFDMREAARQGRDVIADFNVSRDSLELFGLSDPQVTVTAQNGRSVIDYSGGRIILEGIEVTLDELDILAF